MKKINCQNQGLVSRRAGEERNDRQRTTRRSVAAGQRLLMSSTALWLFAATGLALGVVASAPPVQAAGKGGAGGSTSGTGGGIDGNLQGTPGSNATYSGNGGGGGGPGAAGGAGSQIGAGVAAPAVPVAPAAARTAEPAEPVSVTAAILAAARVAAAVRTAASAMSLAAVAMGARLQTGTAVAAAPAVTAVLLPPEERTAYPDQQCPADGVDTAVRVGQRQASESGAAAVTAAMVRRWSVAAH